jgi:predicted PurR-regulated permease PerM
MNFPPPTERQARLIWLGLTGLAVAVLLGLLAALIWGLNELLRLLSPVLWPLAVAGVLAYLLDPVVDLLESRGLPRPRAIVAVFGFALVLVAAISASIIPPLVTQTRQLAVRIPIYAAQVEHRAENWINNPPQLLRRFLERTTQPQTTAQNTPPSAQTPPAITTNQPPAPLLTSTNAPSLLKGTLGKENLETAANWLAEALSSIGSWLFGRFGIWLGALVGIALVPVYTFYFLLEKRGISSRWTDYLPLADSSFKNELVFVLSSINNYLIAFFRGQVLVALCDGTLYGIGFFIAGIPYALLIGVMAVFLVMIPFIGSIITCIAALVIALVSFGDWKHPLYVLLVFGIVQALDSLIISPRIMGGRVGLHPITIIIAVMVGTTLLGGLLGGILAIPLTAALRVLMFHYVWKRPQIPS